MTICLRLALQRNATIRFSYPRMSRGFTDSSPLKAQNVKEVQVATYAKSKKSGTEHTTITLDQSKWSPETSVDNDDRQAVAFDRSIVSKMTPTMKSFTLKGKVAIITGYVLS